MTLYKITIDNRNYGSWTIYNSTTMEAVVIDNFEPSSHKIFTNDVFTFNNGKVEIIHSSIRFSGDIPAVLILADNKTYGRQKGINKSNKQSRLMYKCVPDDTRIPIFLVPYEIKQMGFSKVFSNMYVTINYEKWDDKHPQAKLSQVLGSVDVLDNFYEYQLYCKSLNASIQKFNSDTNKAIKDRESQDVFMDTICAKYPQIENRTHIPVFSIDPDTSLDFDDAFSIQACSNGDTLVSIYIANVTILMDSLNLWQSFSQRISTIYLPDRKRPMLPTILSDCLCSLQQNMRRFAFVLDITIDSNYKIINTTFSNCLINVFKNFAYEERDLLAYKGYQQLFLLTKQLSHNYKYMNNVRNSHDVVCYLMILMNYTCAQDMLKHKNGIFRSTIIKKTTSVSLPSTIPEDVERFIKTWNSVCGQYIDLQTIDKENMDLLIRHELLEMDAYIHITSPIRRLVDLLNIIKFQENHKLISLSSVANDFFNKWISQIDYINITMRAIRRVQNDCSLLDTCYNNPETLDKLYDGFCFDKLPRNDGLYQFIVYIPELKIASRITLRDNLENYEKRQYKLYLFNNEEKFKKKIRLQLT